MLTEYYKRQLANHSDLASLRATAVLYFSIACIPVLLFVISRDALLVGRYSTPIGVDGYYYALQTRTLSATSHLYYASPTPALFYLLSALNSILNDAVLVVACTMIMLNCLLALSLYRFIAVLTNSTSIALACTTTGMFLPSHVFLSTEFLKQGFSIVLLFVSGTLLLHAHRRRSAVMAVAATLAILLALLSHTFAIATIITFGAVFCLLRRFSRYSNFAICGALLLWFFAAVLGALPVDAFAGSGIFVRSWQNLTWWTAEQLALLMLSCISLALYGCLTATLRADSRNCFFATVAVLALAVSVNPFLNHSSDGPAGRVLATACLQVALQLAWVLYVYDWRKNDQISPMVLCVVALLVFGSLSQSYSRGTQPAYLEQRRRIAGALAGVQLPARALVIAPHGDEFTVSFVTGIPAQQRWQRLVNRKMFWLLYTPLADSDGRDLDRLATRQSGSQILIGDAELHEEWRSLTDLTRDRLLAANPELLAAGYAVERD